MALLSGRAVVCRRPLCGGFSHPCRRPRHTVGEPKKKKRILDIEKIRRYPPHKNCQKNTKYCIFRKWLNRKRCNFQCCCNFRVWNWNMKMLRFIAIYTSFVCTASEYCKYWLPGRPLHVQNQWHKQGFVNVG